MMEGSDEDGSSQSVEQTMANSKCRQDEMSLRRMASIVFASLEASCTPKEFCWDMSFSSHSNIAFYSQLCSETRLSILAWQIDNPHYSPMVFLYVCAVSLFLARLSGARIFYCGVRLGDFSSKQLYCLSKSIGRSLGSSSQRWRLVFAYQRQGRQGISTLCATVAGV